MNKTCIIYGSTTGTCQALAEKIAAKLGLASSDVYDVADISAGTADASPSSAAATASLTAIRSAGPWARYTKA